MLVGPNGQMMRANPQLSQAQMEILSRQAAAGQMMANNFPQGLPPNMMPGQQPGQPGQTAPNMTPRQTSGQMPPPPAPQQGAAGNTNPSSPAPPAPPTPNTSAKAKPGGKKDNKGNKVCSDSSDLCVRRLTAYRVPIRRTQTQLQRLQLLKQNNLPHPHLKRQ